MMKAFGMCQLKVRWSTRRVTHLRCSTIDRRRIDKVLVVLKSQPSVSGAPDTVLGDQRILRPAQASMTTLRVSA